MNKKILIGSIIAVAILVGVTFTSVVGFQRIKSNYVLNKINNIPPVADANGPYFSNINEEILFNGSGSYDPDGIIVSYEWDFGDGFTGSGETTTHTYYYPDHYSVILTVTDDDGAIDNDTTTAYVNSPPIEPIIDGPTSGKASTEYEYTFESWDLEEDDIWYKIDWGDGNITDWIGPYYSGEEITISHSWSKNGTYEIRAKAKDIFNAESRWSVLLIGIENHPPGAPVCNGPKEPKLGVEYTYTFTSEDPEGDNISYYIDWGDGNITGWTRYVPSGQSWSCSHAWYSPGIYYFKAKAKDIHGAESNWTSHIFHFPTFKEYITFISGKITSFKVIDGFVIRHVVITADNLTIRGWKHLNGEFKFFKNKVDYIRAPRFFGFQFFSTRVWGFALGEIGWS